MKKALGYIFSPVHYLFFGLLLLVFHPVQWVCLRLGGYKWHKYSVDVLNYLLTATYCFMGSRAHFINTWQIPQGRPVIFVANHQSLYDIPPLIWHLRKHHAKFISKKELAKGIPSISFNLRHGGAANIDRKDAKQAVSEILKLGERMHMSGWSAVIFPEGTRSRDGNIRSFATAGIAALLKKAPEALVVPVAIKGCWRFTSNGTFPLQFGEKMSWTVLAPIEPAGRPVAEVVGEAEQAIRNTAA